MTSDKNDTKTTDTRFARAKNWAAAAAIISGQDASEHLGEAWMRAENSRATKDMAWPIARHDADPTTMDDRHASIDDPHHDNQGQIAETAELVRDVRHAMLSLHPREQHMLARHHGIVVHPQSGAEIAADLSMTRTNVQKIVVKAERRLRNMVLQQKQRGGADLRSHIDGADEPPDQESAGWRYWEQTLATGGDIEAKWDWDACPIAAALYRAGMLPPLRDLMLDGRQEYGSRNRTVYSNHAVGGMDVCIGIEPQTVFVQAAAVPGVLEYRNHHRHTRRVAGFAQGADVVGEIRKWIPDHPAETWTTVPDEIAAVLIGHHVFANMEISGVDRVRHLVKVSGTGKHLGA